MKTIHLFTAVLLLFNILAGYLPSTPAGNARAPLLATLSVTNAGDSGPGTLREAMQNAVNGDVITFDPAVFPPSSPATIHLLSELPYLSQGNITIDASNAGVILDGQSMTGTFDRILNIQSNGNVIRGLQIIYSPFDGILLMNASDNVIGGSSSQGTGLLGQGNLISNNGGHGIQICGDSRNNRISANRIGTDVTGSAARPNVYSGIALQCLPGPSYNIIGGSTASEQNVISGNTYEGVRISDNAHHNQVSGNNIGVSAAGTARLPNRMSGIIVNSGAANNTIGGATAGTRNVISGNNGEGVGIYNDGTNNNIVQGNRVGIDADGTGSVDPRALVVANDGTLFFANYGLGVFRSTNAAVSWQAINSGLSTLNIEVLQVSPAYSTDHTAWAWGEGRLFRTTDGGASWTLASTVLPSNGGMKYDLKVSPNYSSDHTLFAAFSDLYRSTDGGLNWSVVNRYNNNGQHTSIALSPQYGTTPIVLAGYSYNYLTRSTDGGTTWTTVSSGLPTMEVDDIVFAPDGQTVFLVGNHCGGNGEGIYRSTDRGLTWAGSGTGLLDCGSLWKMGFSPNFATDGIAIAVEDQLSRSTDGGSNWSYAGNGVFGSRGIALAFSPNFGTDQTVYAVTFSGIFKSTDQGQTWAWAAANLGDEGNGGSGISVGGGAGPTQVLNNVVGRNRGSGISVEGQAAAGTLIQGNLVGLGPDGVTRASNGATNIRIDAPNITIDANTSSAGSHGGLRTGSTGHHLTITNNRFGTDATGQSAVPNSYDGMTLDSAFNTIRGNVISGNFGSAVQTTTAANNNVFAANLVGLDADGLDLIPNQGSGFVVQANAITIGGSTAADGNKIAGGGISTSGPVEQLLVQNNEISQTQIAIYLRANASNNRILNNNLHHNSYHGVASSGPNTGNLIQSNQIHHNGLRGIVLSRGASQTSIIENSIYQNSEGVRTSESATIQNRISRNSIYDNKGLGILNTGGNTDLSAPVITAFNLASGSASGTACASCTVEVFSDALGEGRYYEGTVTASAAGAWSFAKGSSFSGAQVTATATDAAGNTSEFGIDYPADPPAAPFISYPICGVTSLNQFTFQGTAQMGATVTMSEAGIPYGSAVADDANRWSFNNVPPLEPGAHGLSFRAQNEYGTSPISYLNLSVNTSLHYDPVRVTFSQLGVVQHPKDNQGCADPDHTLGLRLWPGQPVSVRVPVTGQVSEVFIEINSARTYLTDPNGNGIFTGEFNLPASGNYTIILAVSYPGGTETMRIGPVIDPDGYVYDSHTGQKVAGAKVTLYALDTAREKWVTWDAPLYQQANPQTTGTDGYFAFFTPPGQYQLVVEKAGYARFTSPVLTVVDQPIRYNVDLAAEGTTLHLPVIRR